MQNNMSEKKEMKIAEVKGRPMLHWIGKQPLETVKSFPSQLVETFNIEDAPKVPTFENLKNNWTNLLFHGDNKEVLSTLLVNGFRGKVDLIYIDPPFDSGADYVRKVELRGQKQKIESEQASLIEQIQYTDIWANDNYLQFMYERLLLLKELLHKDGTIWVHCDYRKSAYLKFLLDEIFGADNFRSEVIWKQTRAKSTGSKNFGFEHNTLFYYVKGDGYTWNLQHKDYDEDKLDRYYCYFEQEDGSYLKYTKSQMKEFRESDEYPDGRRFALIPLLNLNKNRKNLTFTFKGFYETWATTEIELKKIDDDGLIVQTSPDAMPLKKQYFDEVYGVKVGTIWDDIFPVNSQAKQKTTYPTQKPEELLNRIIESTSNDNAIILDCFMGSGTTAAAAQRKGLRWIGCDINKGSLQTTSKRLQKIIEEQIQLIKEENGKLELEEKKTFYTSFTHYKINDYDLQVQHNELKLLVYEHIGIKRTPTDSFFDGILGTELVKIVPFNHPLSLLDLQLVKTELEKRKDEDRNIVMVSLGMEVKVKTEIDNYNKLRPVNKIRIIELRTDKKYGSFFVHKPAQAEVEITKTKDKGKVILKDFISPTIIQRLNIDSKLFQAKIKDFRSQIDVVIIDTDYNGEVFNICISDVPEKKKDFVKGKYEFAIISEDSKIAVKIIDMLGEEVLIIS